MKHSIMTALVALLAASGCAPPSPDRLELKNRTSPTPPISSLSLVEGDLRVIDSVAIDDDDSHTQLCIEATSSAPATAETLPIQGDCRAFIVTGRAAGIATLTFTAREVSTSLVVTVLPR